MTAKPSEPPARRARLRDEREVELRHARPGDELGIARLLVEAFPVYLRAARGDPERSLRALAGEVEPASYVVAVRAESGEIVGASCLSGRRGGGLGRLRRLRRKLRGWGVYGALCFAVEKLRARLLEAPFEPGPGELYRYNDAVDARLRSLGVGRHVSDFVEEYARAAGYRVVVAKHHADNQPVLALQKKRGCALTSLPRTRFAGWLRRPAMVLSTRALDGADDRDPRRASSSPRCQAVAPTRTVAAAGASSASGSTSGASSL